MSQSLHVRPLESRDVEAVAALRRDALGDGGRDSEPWNEPRRALARKANAEDGLLLVGEAGGRVVATVAGGYDGVRGWVYGLAVADDCRGWGYGRAMLERLEDELLRRGCEKINLQIREGNPATAFYEACGYADDRVLGYGKALPCDPDTPADPVPTIRVGDDIVLSQITPADRDAYLTHFNADPVYGAMMSGVPHPYLDADADRFILRCLSERFPPSLNRTAPGRRSWAVRESEAGPLVGGIGLFGLTPGEKGELGYWLAKPLWGRGIMPRVAAAVCEFAFEEWKLRKVEAHALLENAASQRVLEKACFTREAVLRSHAFVDGDSRDVAWYGRWA